MLDPRCSERNSSRTCEGIVSCYWCVYNKDSVPLKKPYCATAEACFRGKEGLTILCLSINVLVEIYIENSFYIKSFHAFGVNEFASIDY